MDAAPEQAAPRASQPPEGRRAFEPEQAYPVVPDDFAREDFADREVGVLCEQGNFERARILLSKRAAQSQKDASVYLDAIRMERSAAPAGEAWQAWLSRALAVSAQIAKGLRAVVPEEALRAYLVRQGIGWATLEHQRDAAAARDLLRLRLEQQVESDPAAALGAAEDPAMHRGAQQDPALRRVAIAVMAGTVWRFPARVSVLAPHYGIELDASAVHVAFEARDPNVVLSEAHRLQWLWATVTQQGDPPQVLDRFVRVGRLLGNTRARALLSALAADLRARSRDYLSCAETVARVSPVLLLWLVDTVQRADRELRGSAGGQLSAAPRLPHAELDARLAACARDAQRDPLNRLWLVSLLLSLSGLAFAWLWAGPIGALYAPVVLLLVPLRRSVDALLYRRNLRGPLLSAITTHGASIAEVAERMEDSAERVLQRLAVRARADAALVLVSEIACASRGNLEIKAFTAASAPGADTVPA